MGPLFPNRELRLSVDRSPLVGDISRANQLEQRSKLIQGLIATFCLRLCPRVVCVCGLCVVCVRLCPQALGFRYSETG